MPQDRVGAGAHSSGDDKDELGGGGGYMSWKGEELDQSRHVDNATTYTHDTGYEADKEAQDYAHTLVEGIAENVASSIHQPSGHQSVPRQLLDYGLWVPARLRSPY